MAAPKLTEEQRDALIMWLAAEYTEPAIRRFLVDRGWPVISGPAIQHYRTHYGEIIQAARQKRRASALTTGLALKEERVQRLKHHADVLEALKWITDKNGKLPNEKAWRETLDDIARELGHRRTGVDLNVSQMSDAELIAAAAADTGGDGSAWTEGPAEEGEPSALPE